MPDSVVKDYRAAIRKQFVDWDVAVVNEVLGIMEKYQDIESPDDLIERITPNDLFHDGLKLTAFCFNIVSLAKRKMKDARIAAVARKVGYSQRFVALRKQSIAESGKSWGEKTIENYAKAETESEMIAEVEELEKAEVLDGLAERVQELVNMIKKGMEFLERERGGIQ